MSNLYVYESCFPLNSFSTKSSQVIQTTGITVVSLPNEIFKDNTGVCWQFVGVYDNTYTPPFTVFPIYYSGNYFTDVINIKYPSCIDCQSTVVSSCTEVTYSATRCDDSSEVYVKVCDIGPIVGTTKLFPTKTQVVGVINSSGDDFCVTLNSQVSNVQTDFYIVTPAWKNYNCDDCPLYKTYTANSCDGTVTGVTLYVSSSQETLEVGNSVRIDNDDDCYQIISYDGIVVEYNLDNSGYSKIVSSYDDCNSCLINLYSN